MFFLCDIPSPSRYPGHCRPAVLPASDCWDWTSCGSLDSMGSHCKKMRLCSTMKGFLRALRTTHSKSIRAAVCLQKTSVSRKMLQCAVSQSLIFWCKVKTSSNKFSVSLLFCKKQSCSSTFLQWKYLQYSPRNNFPS